MDPGEEFRGLVGKLLADDLPFDIGAAPALAIFGTHRATTNIHLLIVL